MAVQRRTLPAVSVSAPSRMTLRTSSHAMIGTTRGKKWVSGSTMNSTPASAVTMPAAIANGRASRRSDPAIVSIRPAATSNPPIMSDEMVLPAGSSAAPALSAMIAIPATRSARTRVRSDHPR